MYDFFFQVRRLKILPIRNPDFCIAGRSWLDIQGQVKHSGIDPGDNLLSAVQRSIIAVGMKRTNLSRNWTSIDKLIIRAAVILSATSCCNESHQREQSKFCRDPATDSAISAPSHKNSPL